MDTLTDTGCPSAALKPRPVDERAMLLANKQVSPKLHVMRLESPRIAETLAPGQFVHMLIPGMEGHILRRPFSVYDVDSAKKTIDVLYQVVGAGSARMAELETGAVIDTMGPLGTGWAMPEAAHRVLLVGGGVGAAPLYLFAKQLLDAGKELEVVLGAQTAVDLVAWQRYRELIGRDPYGATDDGSLGYHGFCTEVAEKLLATGGFDAVACCGPEPVMRIVAAQAKEAGVSCQVSMEKRMACGIGACLSCIVETVDGRKRSCVDGPVFDAGKVVWA